MGAAVNRRAQRESVGWPGPVRSAEFDGLATPLAGKGGGFKVQSFGLLAFIRVDHLFSSPLTLNPQLSALPRISHCYPEKFRFSANILSSEFCKLFVVSAFA
jgi:hypothetical protein